MRNRDTLRTLELKRNALVRSLREIDTAFEKNMLSKKEYMLRKYDLLGGRFQEDVLSDMDRQMQRLQTSYKTPIAIAAVVLAFAFLIPFLNFGGITGLVTFAPDGSATIDINENYVVDTFKDLTFIETTSVKASGHIYGQGETWIYLYDNGTRKLVYYADTRPQNSITGQVIGVPVTSIPNSTNVTTTVQTTMVVPVMNNTNSTNVTTQTATNASNVTVPVVNNTNSSNSTTTNSTNTTTPVVSPIVVPFNPLLDTDKDYYNVGDNISITVEPSDATITMYMNTPRGTYFMQENYWIALETGDHSITALITKGDDTDRLTKDFIVTGTSQTSFNFKQMCVETCSISETPVLLEVLVSGTRLHLDNVTYVPNNASNVTLPTNTQNVAPPVTAPTKEPLDPNDPRIIMRSCLSKNPNDRRSDCFTAEQLEEKFPNKNFTLVNEFGQTVAIFDRNGNMLIGGNLIDYAQGQSQPLDLVMTRSDKTEFAWIDAITGDLYLRGTVLENQETLAWETRRDYVVANTEGMYLGIFAETGHLYLRGALIEGGLR